MALPYFIDHYGDVASVIGLLISFIGFLVTIRNVGKARTAAEAAQSAALEVVSRIKSQVLVAEIATCLRFVREIDAGCRDREWDKALKACDDARSTLSKLSNHQVLVEIETNSVTEALEHMGNLLPYIQKIRDSEPERYISPQKVKLLHQIITSLGQIQGRLESKSFEV